MSRSERNLFTEIMGQDPVKWKPYFEQRIVTCNEGAKRTRYAILLNTLFAVGLCLVMFDYFFSWNRFFSEQVLAEIKDGCTAEEIGRNLMRADVISEWMSTQVYQLPFLGIKIMASDLPMLGPLALILCSTWLFFIIRREHYSTTRLLSEVYQVHQEHVGKRQVEAIIFAQHVYHQIIGQTVFNVIDSDRPVASLKESIRDGRQVGRVEGATSMRHLLYRGMLWFPFFAILFIAAIRALTIFWLRSHVTGNELVWSKLDVHRKSMLLLSIGMIVIGLVITAINAGGMIRLNRATRKLLDDYQNWAWKGIKPGTKSTNSDRVR